jgi:hypothetical protein
MMNSWIEIFRTGVYPEGTFTKEDLDVIARDYRPQVHEAPVVVGHPEHNKPAFGWVEALRREGNILLAKFKDVIPEFADMVRRGLFKKRSASFYMPYLSPTGHWYLRHVGFLGAAPPIVKGLQDIRFVDSRYNVDIKFAQQSAFERLVEKYQAEKGLSRGRAISFAAKHHPEAHAEYLQRVNII